MRSNTSKTLTSQNILQAFVILLMVVGPMSTTFLNKIVVLVLFAAGMATLILALISGDKIKVWSVSGLPSLLYLGLMLVGLVAIILHRDYLTGDFVASVIIGRLFTLITAVLALYLLNMWLTGATSEDVRQVMWVAFASGALFIFFGIWQFVGNVLGIPFFIETRDWMHGVPQALRTVVPKRLTSLAEEPNFLAPILVEFLLLSVLLIKSRFGKFIAISAGLFVSLFSFSGGAYINLALIVLIFATVSLAYNVLRGKVSIYDIGFFVGMVLLSLAIMSVGDILIEFMVQKIQTESSGSSSRSQFLVSLTQMILESDWVSLIFGHGLATMSVLNEFGMSADDYLFRISNNFYLDMLWETGFIGLLILSVMFITLLLPGLKGFFGAPEYRIGLILTIHLMITSLYRSEYLSSHFIWVLALIFMCYLQGARQQQNKQGAHERTLRT